MGLTIWTLSTYLLFAITNLSYGAAILDSQPPIDLLPSNDTVDHRISPLFGANDFSFLTNGTDDSIDDTNFHLADDLQSNDTLTSIDNSVMTVDNPPSVGSVTWQTDHYIIRGEELNPKFPYSRLLRLRGILDQQKRVLEKTGSFRLIHPSSSIEGVRVAYIYYSVTWLQAQGVIWTGSKSASALSAMADSLPENLRGAVPPMSFNISSVDQPSRPVMKLVFWPLNQRQYTAKSNPLRNPSGRDLDLHIGIYQARAVSKAMAIEAFKDMYAPFDNDVYNSAHTLTALEENVAMDAVFPPTTPRAERQLAFTAMKNTLFNYPRIMVGPFDAMLLQPRAAGGVCDIKGRISMMYIDFPNQMKEISVS